MCGWSTCAGGPSRAWTSATARAIATLDALGALAEAASSHNYSAPTLHDGDDIEIKNGRHPVVEAAIGSRFIPNDIVMNNSTDRLLILTGANMGGKSTYMRQVALIVRDALQELGMRPLAAIPSYLRVIDAGIVRFANFLCD